VAHCGLGLGERESIATCRQGDEAQGDEVAALPDERTSILDLEALAPYGYAKEHFGYRDRLSVPTIEDVLSDPGRVEIDFDGALRYRARAPTPGASFGAEIGIGGSLTAPPLPHHRTYGSVYGGSMD
jgi:hypothetical protein